jgi:hypothetical protein
MTACAALFGLTAAALTGVWEATAGATLNTATNAESKVAAGASGQEKATANIKLIPGDPLPPRTDIDCVEQNMRPDEQWFTAPAALKACFTKGIPIEPNVKLEAYRSHHHTFFSHEYFLFRPGTEKCRQSDECRTLVLFHRLWGNHPWYSKMLNLSRDPAFDPDDVRCLNGPPVLVLSFPASDQLLAFFANNYIVMGWDVLKLGKFDCGVQQRGP